jgi:hypothetical protein
MGGGAKSYHREKAWLSKNHAMLSGYGLHRKHPIYQYQAVWEFQMMGDEG